MKDIYLKTQIDESLVIRCVCVCGSIFVQSFRGIKSQVVDGLSAAKTAVSMLPPCKE